MKKQFNIGLIIGVLFSILGLSSCLKSDLPQFDNWDGVYITLVNTEHRFLGTRMMHGEPVVEYQRLNTTVVKTDTLSGTIDIAITVPAAGTGQFNAAERAKVVQSNIWFYMNLSPAATIMPLEGTPKPGDSTDATKPLTYQVTAANGSKKIWTINVIQFTK